MQFEDEREVANRNIRLVLGPLHKFLEDHSCVTQYAVGLRGFEAEWQWKTKPNVQFTSSEQMLAINILPKHSKSVFVAAIRNALGRAGINTYPSKQYDLLMPSGPFINYCGPIHVDAWDYNKDSQLKKDLLAYRKRELIEHPSGVAYPEFKFEHRTPRVLVVVTKSTPFPLDPRITYYPTLTDIKAGIDCFCSKYPIKDGNNFHVLAPEQYEKPLIQSVIDTCRLAAEAGTPYDLIIADSSAYKWLIGYGSDFNPLPGRVLFTQEIITAKISRGLGIPALSRQEMTDVQIVDKVFDKALGAKGIEQLKLRAGDLNAYDHYAESKHGHKVVTPPGAVALQPTQHSLLALKDLRKIRSQLNALEKQQQTENPSPSPEPSTPPANHASRSKSAPSLSTAQR